MQKASCQVAVLSIRKQPDETSEMLSQMLYGERCSIVDKKGDYAKIITDFDEISGWVLGCSLKEENDICHKKILHQKIANLNGNMLVSIGSEIINSKIKDLEIVDNEIVINLAKHFLHTPYLYGGRSIFGIDAGALVQLVYKVLGITLPRFPQEQADFGTTLDFVEECEGGEIAFFEDENGKIHHTGIMLNTYEILHCYGSVRIDDMDSTGIFNKDLNRHTHRLRFVKRILE